jgi:pimeloyl-ACP methyl ester carboxylesterase
MKFCHELNIKAAAVVGISFGGAVAALLSHDKKLVSKLVLINTAGVPRQASFAKMFANLLKSSAFMLAHGRVEHIFYRFSAAFSFFASLRHREMRKLFSEIESSTKTHICYIFQNITAKTTLVWCTKDFMFPLSNAYMLQKLIKHSKLVIVEGDHYWPFHKPKHFAETILAHVK